MKKLKLGVLRACLYITSLYAPRATLEGAPAKKIEEKKTLESYSVGVVGKEVITHQDVLQRLAMETKFFRRVLTPENYSKLYEQSLESLVNESRQRQAPTRLISMAKNAHQTQAIKGLLPAEIKREVEERLKSMAESNHMTPTQFREFLGENYSTFYQKQEAMVSFQRFLMVKWGARAMRNIVGNAIAKARKKWKSLQGSTQYKVSEIVIYNRQGKAFSQDQMLEIQELLNGGESFSELASRFSQARSSEHSGDCGWRVLNYFDGPLQDFLRTAAIGDISPVFALPTAAHPEKWVIILLTDQRTPGRDGVALEQDPGDDVFRNNLFAMELERLAKSEMEDLAKSFPCTLNIKKK